MTLSTQPDHHSSALEIAVQSTAKRGGAVENPSRCCSKPYMRSTSSSALEIAVQRRLVAGHRSVIARFSHHDLCRTQYWCSRLGHHRPRAVPFPTSADNTPAILNAHGYSVDSSPWSTCACASILSTNQQCRIHQQSSTSSYIRGVLPVRQARQTGCSLPGKFARIGILPLFCAIYRSAGGRALELSAALPR